MENVADIQMKHNLLQQVRLVIHTPFGVQYTVECSGLHHYFFSQLEANRYNLSYIFTTKTRAEQMAMITIDRQMMIHRLAQSNSKTKRLLNVNVNRPRSMSVEDKLKKLTVVEL